MYILYTSTINDIMIKQDGDIVTFDIIGEGFMMYMVRNIVGALLAHNRWKIDYNDLRDWLDNPSKGKAHYKAEGAGLYLAEVYY